MKKDDPIISFTNLKHDIQLKAKNGIDFILAASLAWFVIFLIWKFTQYTSYEKSVLTFIFGAIMIPLAFAFSKVLKTTWTIKNNPLQPLGLWLNIAQLIYFPILFFILITNPDYFIMAYAIITGAHLFPYAWFYDEIGYAVSAVTISVGSLLLAISMNPADIYFVPLLTASVLLVLGIRIAVQNHTMQKTNVPLESP